MRKGSLIIYVFLIALVTVSLVACQQTTGEKVDTASSVKAPAFVLQSLDGDTFDSASLKGKVVLLNFWRTNCPPCRMEVPDFQELYEKYSSSGFEVVGIALDREGATAVKPFVEVFGVTYTILFPNEKVMADYGPIRYIPTTFLIDREGNVKQQFVGYRDKQTFEKAIINLL